jgi:hypothetical protein
MVSVKSGSQASLWQQLVREAEDSSQRTLDESLESYLVFTLMRFTADEQLVARVMALDFLEGMQSSGKQKEMCLRDVGDRCLLLAGLYPDAATRKRVSLKYFCDLGQSAYDELASHMKAALASLYAQLAHGFHAMVRVLIEVRKLSKQWQGPDFFSRYALAHNAQGIDAQEAERQFPGAIVLTGAGHG